MKVEIYFWADDKNKQHIIRLSFSIIIQDAFDEPNESAIAQRFEDPLIRMLPTHRKFKGRKEGSLNFFQASNFQLHKLENSLR